MHLLVFMVSGFWLRSFKVWFFCVCLWFLGFCQVVVKFSSLCVFLFLCMFFCFRVPVTIIPGNNYSCFCKNDSGWFKKDLASWVLPCLGCFLSAPEVKLSHTPTIPFLVPVYVMYVLMMLLIWFLFFFISSDGLA